MTTTCLAWNCNFRLVIQNQDRKYNAVNRRCQTHWTIIQMTSVGSNLSTYIHLYSRENHICADVYNVGFNSNLQMTMVHIGHHFALQWWHIWNDATMTTYHQWRPHNSRSTIFQTQYKPILYQLLLRDEVRILVSEEIKINEDRDDILRWYNYAV